LEDKTRSSRRRFDKRPSSWFNRTALNAENSAGKSSVSLFTATCIVVANMVGTGIFTSLGFQIGDLPSGFAIMILWAVGGVCALCGALAYAELGAALPRSGGEYHFLGTIFHPAVGFLAGWVSATVGFAAPVALAAMAFGKYLADFFPWLPTITLIPAGHFLNQSMPAIMLTPPVELSLAVVFLTTLVLLRDVNLGSVFQDGATLLKVALILVLIGAGLLAGHSQPISFWPAVGDGRLIASAPFAISLVYVMYAYSGWNASTYIVGEVRNPARTIPLSVGLGTAAVMLLYLAVNAVFLRTTPAAEMVGKPQVALIAGIHIFGATGAKVVAVLICAGLVSTISAMMWIGPRVTVAMGEDLRALHWLARKNTRGIPVTAMLVQFAIVILLLLTSTFEQVMTYVQFALQSCSFLTVLGLIVLRVRRPDLARPYKTWGYPLTPLIFLAISAWMLVQIFRSNPRESLSGLATMASGLVVYFVFQGKAAPAKP
jgi:APA family basic amino acid/polyamine antiporter